MEFPLLELISKNVSLSDDELDAIRGIHRKKVVFDKGESVTRHNTEGNPIYIMEEGWASQERLYDGGRLQIVNFILPGEFIGLDTLFLKASHFTTTLITESKLWLIDSDDILMLFKECPRAAASLFWYLSERNLLLAGQIIRLGKMNAKESVAHFLLELEYRLKRVGRSIDGSFDFPITQEMLADALGMTAVHINRTMRKLEKDKLIKYGQNKMILYNREKLLELSEFIPDYLEIQVSR